MLTLELLYVIPRSICKIKYSLLDARKLVIFFLFYSDVNDADGLPDYGSSSNKPITYVPYLDPLLQTKYIC